MAIYPRRTDAGFELEPIPAVPVDADPYCKPQAAQTNVPRLLAAMVGCRYSEPTGSWQVLGARVANPDEEDVDWRKPGEGDVQTPVMLGDRWVSVELPTRAAGGVDAAKLVLVDGLSDAELIVRR